MRANHSIRKPGWLKMSLPSGKNYKKIKNYLQNYKLTTVCEEAKCPNIGQCWNSGTATFMLMGNVCTRACRFCSVKTDKNPQPLDNNEPKNLSKTIAGINLKYVVLTTVDRDDIVDMGASHIRRCLEEIKTQNPNIIIEALIPDFQGNVNYLDEVLKGGARVVGHNIECVNRVSKQARDSKASYQQSLDVLKHIKSSSVVEYLKSSFMLGFGESNEEALETMQDLFEVGVDFLTIGQYLQPSKQKIPVSEFLEPQVFNKLEKEALKMGFKSVASGPLVRSSFNAAKMYYSSAQSSIIPM
jgi:lipoyl synthase